jgi:transposase
VRLEDPRDRQRVAGAAEVERNNPKRGGGSESSYSLTEFMREFPDDATCLEWLWRERISEDGEHADCPKCDRKRRFHKVRSRPSWSCDSCGHHLHPTAGTIFHKSPTSLHLWFYATYLMTSTRCGISAKQIERELGVTYKTAWRMANKIRNILMIQDDDPHPFGGEVEADGTEVGGRPRESDRRRYGGGPEGHAAAQRERRERNASVFGMIERGGCVRMTAVPDKRCRQSTTS